MIPLALFAVALLVRLAVGMLFAGPAYPDSYYYVNVAQQLAAGNGFTVDYIWSFIEVGGRLPAEATLPIASNAHWMPLASLVQVPFIWLLGATPLAFGLPFWIAGAAAAPLAWLIGRDAGLPNFASVAAGLMVALPGGMTSFLSQPDNFGLFVTFGALALWLCGRGLRGDRRAFVLGGLVVGLATLSRNDGVLLGVPFALAAAGSLLRRSPNPPVSWSAAIACAGLFVMVMAPWLLRQLDVFGTISPSAATGRVLWVADYLELHSISGPDPSPATLFAQDLGPLLESRLDALVTIIVQFLFLPLAVVLAPFALLGAWLRRRDPHFQPFLLYAVLLFAAHGLLFAVHVRHGIFLHSAVALLPHTYLLVAIGITGAVGWVARRRSSWKADQAARFFTAGAVIVVLAGTLIQVPVTLGRWHEVQSVQRELVGGLERLAEPGDRLMSVDAGAYRYLGGYPGVISPNDPLEVVEQVARAYDVRWLALEREQVQADMEPLLRGDVRPAWLSAPLARVGAADDRGAPAGALFAVCFEPADTRCAP